MRAASLAAAVVLTLLALPGAAKPTTRVHVETFTVGFTSTEGEALFFSRLEEQLTGGENPDTRARKLAGRVAGEIVLIHSTSWRWEKDGRIVLTYVAWAKEGRLRGAEVLPKLSPPGQTDPLNPRPAKIKRLDPLAHGLRHLAFLLRTDREGKVAASLGPRSVEALKRLEPDVAGEIESR